MINNFNIYWFSLARVLFQMEQERLLKGKKWYFFRKVSSIKVSRGESKIVQRGQKNTRKFDGRLQHENTINRLGETIHVELLLDTNDCLSRSFVLSKTMKWSQRCLCYDAYHIFLRCKILIFLCAWFYTFVLFLNYFFTAKRII